MPTPTANTSRFSIAIDSVNIPLRLVRLEGRTQISGLFYYDIRFANKSINFELESLIDKAVLVTVHDPQFRFIRGYINEAGFVSHGTQYSEYRIQLVPRLWHLTQRLNQRIFQDQNSNDIIALILQEHGISGDQFLDLTIPGPKRPYCVQYHETDFDFVQRLMREEGRHFHFQNNADLQILVMAEDNNAFAPKTASPTLRYEQETSRPQDEECVHLLHACQQVTAGAVRLNDYFFEAPERELNQIKEGLTPPLELYHYPGGYAEEEQGAALAQYELEQIQGQQALVEMSTHTPHCDAGQFLALEKHPDPAMNREYLVVESELLIEQPQALDEGSDGGSGRCISQLRCMPFETLFRTAPGTQGRFKKPVISGLQNAVVTGPPNEEIYTDQFGRVKVQFFWDREAMADEATSCWLRVNQPVAGLEWGGIALPRIGQEVLVEFEFGDPDRPIMTGRVYNGQNQVPYALPQHKSRAALKTLSTPGGGGYNEIRIDDSKGAEQVLLRAERDLDIRVQAMHRQQTVHDQHLSVTGLACQETGKDWHQTSGANETEQTTQNLSLNVAEDLQLQVNGAHVVDAGQSVHIKAGSKAVIEGGLSLSVKGGAGMITLDTLGVALVGPLININDGGSTGESVEQANPSRPGTPAEADNDRPGAQLRAATASVTPLPAAIDFEQIAAQRAVMEEAKLSNALAAEDCPACALTAATAPEE
ncbi:type VI secretion system tip protein VgrG [Ketobacter sp. MCCC 1A13808]|uniref:type VI secretion system Vgr family protein n=1 Tax=Ketobacter sp. MCCC 1A13808 TaxID=2602738 RepID=UPI000F205383|nr:type VI secretion system tip protein TssI/VgrG [Ketobacter sp. MCCC 1A13808]MVF10943.1 type VI secretion system tip protein VgrG [Ketobacter sp. MCCC 1A13808]RLP56334.1 MAG: type VI secretion system tip protein VgrG [Ketobacter sp.]